MGMHSKVFRMMLFNGMKESSQTVIPLLDVDKDTLLQLLGCIFYSFFPSIVSHVP